MKRKSQFGKRALRKVTYVSGIVVCIILSFILICNVTNCICRAINPNRPPMIFGITPMVVLSGSMSGDAPDSMEPNDLIFVKKVKMEKLETGDIIAFYYGNIIVSHRIIDIKTAEDGSLYFTTKGDANNTAEEDPIKAENLIGLVCGRIPHLGGVFLFLQQPVGLLLFCVFMSIIILPYYLLGKRKRNEKCASASEMIAEAESSDKSEHIDKVG